METREYQLNILGTYREAEVQGAQLLQRLLRNNDDQKMINYLTWQLADESYHIQLLTELICEMGGAPAAIHKQALPSRCGHGLPATLLEILAYLHATEARLLRRYHAHVMRQGEDPRIVSTLQTLASDEEWHLAGIKALLLKQEKKFGRTRVAATLDHYWDLVRYK